MANMKKVRYEILEAVEAIVPSEYMVLDGEGSDAIVLGYEEYWEDCVAVVEAKAIQYGLALDEYTICTLASEGSISEEVFTEQALEILRDRSSFMSELEYDEARDASWDW